MLNDAAIGFSPATLGPTTLGTLETALIVALVPIVAGLMIGMRRETSVFLGVIGVITLFAVQ